MCEQAVIERDQESSLDLNYRERIKSVDDFMITDGPLGRIYN